MSVGNDQLKAAAAKEFKCHAEKLSLLPQNAPKQAVEDTSAVQAKFITPQDPIIELSNGGKLPAVPLAEAVKLNELKEKAEGAGTTDQQLLHPERDNGNDVVSIDGRRSQRSERGEAPLSKAIPPSRTNPLFPDLPLYGPPTLLRDLECWAFRLSSSVLSLAFLGVIVLGAAFTSIPLMLKHIGILLRGKIPNARRPFYEEEKRRQSIRKAQNDAWERRKRRCNSRGRFDTDREDDGPMQEFEPLEGGRDPLICDITYYARRVGLDVEEFKVQTEDGFMIDLWHVYNPNDYTPASPQHRNCKSPEIFKGRNRSGGESESSESSESRFRGGERRYPVLLMPGLLQSAGAYCSNDDDSLAFFLCKRYASTFYQHDQLTDSGTAVMMFGSAIIGVGSIQNTKCSHTQTLECGRGTFGRWVSWTYLHIYRVSFSRQASRNSVSSAILKGQLKPSSLSPKNNDPTSETRSASSARSHQLYTPDL